MDTGEKSPKRTGRDCGERKKIPASKTEGRDYNNKGTELTAP